MQRRRWVVRAFGIKEGSGPQSDASRLELRLGWPAARNPKDPGVMRAESKDTLRKRSCTGAYLVSLDRILPLSTISYRNAS